MMMDKSQRLQLKVLIKTRINQVNKMLNYKELDSVNESSFKQEVESLEFNLKRLDDNSINVCENCGSGIKYTHLITRPDTKFCERCSH